MSVKISSFCSLLIIAFFAAPIPASAGDLIEVTDRTFSTEVEEASKGQTVIAFFRTEWCGPCRAMLPGLIAFAREENLKLVAVDADANPAVTQKLGVASLPFTAVFKDARVTNSFLGAAGKEKLRTLIQAKSEKK